MYTNYCSTHHTTYFTLLNIFAYSKMPMTDFPSLKRNKTFTKLSKSGWKILLQFFFS